MLISEFPSVPPRLVLNPKESFHTMNLNRMETSEMCGQKEEVIAHTRMSVTQCDNSDACLRFTFYDYPSVVSSIFGETMLSHCTNPRSDLT